MDLHQEHDNQMQASLEVAPLDWIDDENTPDLHVDDQASQSKQRRTDQVY